MTPVLARRFHEALAEAIVAVAARIMLPRVALSGGCFQNRLLLELVAPRLQRLGLRLLLHRQTPCNDGGVSLGQAVVANFAP